jgi:putative nucleotidyltransferase with HDIG domain
MIHPVVKVLFVDDEAYVLDGLRRSMHSMRHQWDMRFATSGEHALTMLAQYPSDVILSDMRMPGINGIQLLNEVKRLYPGIIRFVLSGYAAPSAVLQSAATAHQYMAKPCDTAALQTAIRRAQSLQKFLGNKRIAARAGASEALPIMPTAYRRIVACLENRRASIADVAEVVQADLAVSTMALKLANSAFFGSAQRITSIERAVSFLGTNNVAALVLASGVFEACRSHTPAAVDVANLWQHSLTTATIARALALKEKWSAGRADDAFLAGLLHDLGHLLASTDPSDHGTPDTPGIEHGQLGAYLVGLWGFPDSLIEAIAFHHQPSVIGTPGMSFPALLHAANLLAHGGRQASGVAGHSGLDEECFGAPDMLERWQVWQASVLPLADSSEGAAR